MLASNSWKSQGLYRPVMGLFYLYVYIHTQIQRGADKFLARPGRKQARKHVRRRARFQQHQDANFHKVFLFSCKARRRKKFTPFWRKRLLVSFLVGPKTYQNQCNSGRAINSVGITQLNNHACGFKRAYFLLIGKGKAHSVIGTEALYRPNGP